MYIAYCANALHRYPLQSPRAPVHEEQRHMCQQQVVLPLITICLEYNNILNKISVNVYQQHTLHICYTVTYEQVNNLTCITDC